MRRFVGMMLLVCFGLYGTGAFWFAHMELSHSHGVSVVDVAGDTDDAFGAGSGEEHDGGGSAGKCDICDMLAAVRVTMDEGGAGVCDVLGESGVVSAVELVFVGGVDVLCWGARGPPAVV